MGDQKRSRKAPWRGLREEGLMERRVGKGRGFLQSHPWPLPLLLTPPTPQSIQSLAGGGRDRDMGELGGGCSGGGAEKAASIFHTGAIRAQRSESAVDWGLGRVDSSGTHWILRLKDDSSSLPLGLSSLRMSFSLFWGCLCLARAELLLCLGSGMGLSSGVGGSQ